MSDAIIQGFTLQPRKAAFRARHPGVFIQPKADWIFNENWALATGIVLGNRTLAWERRPTAEPSPQDQAPE